ncbi:MAG: autotransporter-associated beta strand repeat-containing protein [Verrucomicrobia bacterium]|nr:autotransporter-associated beta strand repeat-containing protein [Verrucomicrobiota bacterium]
MKKAALLLIPALALITTTSAQAQTIVTNGYVSSVGAGTVTLNGGGLLAGNNITFTVTNNIVLGTNGGLFRAYSSYVTGVWPFQTTYNDGNLVINGSVSGSGGATFQDGGIMQFNASNSYTGNTTFDGASGGASVDIGNVNAFSGSTVVLSGFQSLNFTAGGTKTYNFGGLSGSQNLGLGANTLSVGANNQNNTYSGALSGTGGFVKAGSGTQTLSGNNSFTGGITVNGGTLAVDNLANNANNDITINSGSKLVFAVQDVFAQWNATINPTITINEGGVLANDGVNFNALGDVVLNGGTIQSLGATGANASGTAFGLKGLVSVIGSATSTIAGAGIALGEAGVTNTTFQVTNSATLNVTGNLANGDSASWGVKQTGNLIKTGAGTMLLSGTNTYTGTTTVGEGLLEFAKTNSLYNGTTSSWTANNITVSNGATLAFAVGGAGQFSTSNITTILSNLGGTSGKGFLSNSSIGFDVAGGIFTLTNNLGNSTNGTLGLLAYGGNTLTLTGSNSYTGTTRIDSATILQVGNGGTSGTIGSGTVSNSGSLIFNRSGTLSVTAPITGTGDVRQIGLGTTTLTGSNSYTGTTTVSAGVLNIGNLGTGNLVIDSGAGHSTNLLVNGGTLNNASGIIGNGVGTVGSVTVTSGSWNNSDFLYIGYYGSSSNSLTISNAGTVRVADTGGWLGLGEYGGSANNLTVTGSNSTLWVNTSRYGSYGIWIGDGYDGDAVASSSNTMVVSAGGKVYSGGESGIGGSGAGVGNTALVTGTGSLWSNNGALNIGGAYQGSTSEGALTVTKGGSVVANDIYIANNAGTVGVLNIGSLGGTDTAGTVTASTIQFGDGTGSINFNQRDATTIDSQISGSGSVNQLGTGTTTLGGANTYTGLTKITAGTLALGAGGSLATNSSAQIDIGAKFDLSTRNQSLNDVKANGTIAGSGTMTVTGTLSGSGTVAADTVVTGTHSPGNSPGIQTFGGNLTYQSGAGILLEFADNTTVNSPLAYDQILVGKDLNFSGLTSLNISFGETGSAVDWNNAFWQTSQSWTLYSVGGTTAGFGNLTLNTTNWTDASGDLFGNVLSGGNFSLAQNGNNVVLNYAVPEPSTYALMGLGALALVIAYRRKRA